MHQAIENLLLVTTSLERGQLQAWQALESAEESEHLVNVAAGSIQANRVLLGYVLTREALRVDAGNKPAQQLLERLTPPLQQSFSPFQPDESKYWLSLGNHFYLQGQRLEAMTCWSECLTISDANSLWFGGVHSNLGTLYREAGRSEEAEEQYLSAIEHRDYKAHNSLGTLYREAGRSEEAEEQYLDAIKHKVYDAHVNLGVLYHKTNRPEEAEEQYLSAIEHRDYKAHNSLGNLYREAGRFEEAEEQYLSAIQQESYGAHFNLGVLFWTSRRRIEAVEQLELAVDREVHVVSASLALGKIRGARDWARGWAWVLEQAQTHGNGLWVLEPYDKLRLVELSEAHLVARLQTANDAVSRAKVWSDFESEWEILLPPANTIAHSITRLREASTWYQNYLFAITRLPQHHALPPGPDASKAIKRTLDKLRAIERKAQGFERAAAIELCLEHMGCVLAMADGLEASHASRVEEVLYDFVEQGSASISEEFLSQRAYVGRLGVGEVEGVLTQLFSLTLLLPHLGERARCLWSGLQALLEDRAFAEEFGEDASLATLTRALGDTLLASSRAELPATLGLEVLERLDEDYERFFKPVGYERFLHEESALHYRARHELALRFCLELLSERLEAGRFHVLDEQHEAFEGLSQGILRAHSIQLFWRRRATQHSLAPEEVLEGLARGCPVGVRVAALEICGRFLLWLVLERGEQDERARARIVALPVEEVDALRVPVVVREWQEHHEALITDPRARANLGEEVKEATREQWEEAARCWMKPLCDLEETLREEDGEEYDETLSWWLRSQDVLGDVAFVGLSRMLGPSFEPAPPTIDASLLSLASLLPSYP